MAKNLSISHVTASNQPSNGTSGRPIHNEILLSLSEKERAAVLSASQFVELPIHTVLNEMGERIEDCYFINSGLISIVNVLSGGKTVEVGLTGKDGFVGLPLIVGLSTSATRAIAQIAATGFRISVAKMAEVLQACPQLETKLNRYSQALGMQATQVAACNRVHEVEERLARWLLMCQDRIGGSYVQLTQEFLSHMLGTRRASVTVAAGILQKAGLITYERGTVKIVKRENLKNAACECYQTITEQARNWQRESQ